MQKIAFAIGTILLVAAAGLLVAPSFIDWSNYRAAFESRLADATGRAVNIQGDVSLTLLPRPALQVDGVTISSLPGATSPEFAQAERVAVNLAFAPMLQGRLQFTSIEIIEPVIHLEVLEDGSQTWALAPGEPERPAAGAGSGPQQAAFDLGVDALIIVGGTINYTDVQRNISQSFSNVDIELGAESAAGPFDAVGNVTAFGLAWQADISIGTLRRDRPGALVATLTNVESGLTVDLTGSVALSDNTPVIAGRLEVFGDSVAAALQSLDMVTPDQRLPKALAESYRAESRFSLQNGTFDAESIALRIGRTTAQGKGLLSWQGSPVFDLTLSITRLDLANWQFAEAGTFTRFAVLPDVFWVRPAHAQTVFTPLPRNLSGTVSLDVGLIAWRGQVMRNGTVNASFKESVVTVSDMHVDLPGNARIDVSGTVDTNAGEPVLNLKAGASARDLRSLLDWLGIAPSPGVIAPSRLNSFSMASNVRGTPSRLAVNEIQVALDTTAIEGSVILDDLSPLKATVDLSASALDLDSYLPALMERFTSSTAPPDQETSDNVRESSGESAAERHFLTNVTSDFEVTVGALTVQSNVFRGVVVSGKTEQGTVIIETATVEDFAGAELSSSGRISSALTNPTANDMRVSLTTSDFSRVSRALGLDLPPLDLLAGAVGLEGMVTGSVEESTIDVSAKVGGLTLSVSGVVNTVLQSPSANVAVTANHEDYTQLLAGLGLSESIATDTSLALNIAADVAAAASTISVQKIDIGIGENSLTGTLDYVLSDARPKLSGSIAAKVVNGDVLIPADETQRLTRASAGRGATGTANISRRWSTDPIDLGFLERFDAEIELTADRLRVRAIDVDQFAATATLQDGVLSLNDWRGALYGGPSQGNFTLTVGPTLNINTNLIVTDAALHRVVEQQSDAAPAQGRLALRGAFSASGNTQQALVTSLTGEGMFSATGIDANADGQGFGLAVVLAPVRALSQLGGVFSGGVTEGLASVGTSFNGKDGVFSFADATLESNVYSGVFSGDVDLPRWEIDARGRVTLEVNLITQLLGNRLQMPNLVPITVQGPLDLPNVTMNTGLGGQAEQTGESGDPPQNDTGSSLLRSPTQLFQSIVNEFANPQ